MPRKRIPLEVRGNRPPHFCNFLLPCARRFDWHGMATRKSRDDSSERPDHRHESWHIQDPCGSVAFPLFEYGLKQLVYLTCGDARQRLRTSSRSRIHPAGASPARSKESITTSLIDQNGATRPMFIAHPVHLLKQPRRAPIRAAARRLSTPCACSPHVGRTKRSAQCP